MLPGLALYVLAVVVSATQSLPLYADSALTPQEELFQKLVAEWEMRQKDEPSEQREIQHVFPVLVQQERDPDSGRKGAKEALQQEKMNRMGDYLKAAVLKLAAADSLRSQAFVRSEQNLPKPNKRGNCWDPERLHIIIQRIIDSGAKRISRFYSKSCFWKYCVTN